MTTKDIYNKLCCCYENGSNNRLTTIELQAVSFECDTEYIIPNFASTEYDDNWYLTYYEPRIKSKHIIHPTTHEFMSQYDYVLRKLQTDRYTRQAMLIMTSETEYDRNGLMMCLISMQYFINKNQLDVVVNMRSSDVYRFHQDLLWQKKILSQLVNDYNKDTEHKLVCGKIVWNVGSLHIYKQYWDKLKQI